MDFAVGAAARRLAEAATAAADVVAVVTTDIALEDAPAEQGGIDAADAPAAVAAVASADPSRSYKLMLGAAVIMILGAYLCFRGGKNRLAAFFAKFFYFNTLIQIRLFSILDCYCGYDRSTTLAQRCSSRTPRDAPHGLIGTTPSRARCSWPCTPTAWATSSRPSASYAYSLASRYLWTRWPSATCRKSTRRFCRRLPLPLLPRLPPPRTLRQTHRRRPRRTSAM